MPTTASQPGYYSGLTGPVAGLNTEPTRVPRTTSSPAGGVGSTLGSLGDFGGAALFGKPNKKNKPKAPLANQIYRRGKGTLQAYNALLGPTEDLLTAAGQADLNRFALLAPGYVNAITGADPMQAQLRAKANADAMSGMDSTLDPSIVHEIQQGNRAAWTSRGLVEAPAAATSELFALGERGNALRQQGRANAYRMLGINQSIIGDPLLAVTGRPSGVRGIGDVPNDALNMQLNAEQQRLNKAAADAANRTALQGAGISAVGSLAGGAAGAI